MRNFQNLILLVFVMAFIGFATSAAVGQSNRSATATEAARSKPCLNPSIDIVYQESGYDTPGGLSNTGACSPKLYNNASWRNDAALKTCVRRTVDALNDAAYEFKLVRESENASRIFPVLTDGGRIVASAGNRRNVSAGSKIAASCCGNLTISAAEFYRLTAASLIAINPRFTFAADEQGVKSGRVGVVYQIN
jgi:hypothetical protein